MALQALVMPLVSIFRSTGFKEAIKAVNGLDGEFKKVAQSAGLAAGSFAASAVLQKVTQYIDEAVVATQKYERNMLALNQVFGSQMGVMRQFTKDAQAMGISQGQAAQAGVFLGSVLKQYGLSAEQTTSDTQKLINLSQDLATTYGYDLQEALLAMTALFRGEYDPIEKFGVAMKQNEINALLAARGQDKLTGTMLFQAQVQARLDLLYQRSADSIGAYERAQGTLYVAQQNLNAALENQQIAFGEGLQQPLSAVTNIFADIVTQLTPAAAVIGQVLGSIIDFAAKVGGGFLNGVAQSISNIIGLIPAAITGLYELTLAINSALGGRGPQDTTAKSDERSRQIAKLTADVAYAQQILTAKQAEGALGLSQYEKGLRDAQNALTTYKYGTTSASEEEQLFRNRIDATARSLEDIVPPTDVFIKKLQDLGIYTVDAEGALTGLASIFSDIDNAAKQSEAADELAKIGFNADQIATILSKPDWATIFGQISRYAKIAAIDVASIGGSAQYAAAVAQGQAQAILNELMAGLKSDTKTGTSVTNYVKEFYDNINSEIAKQSARTKLTEMGASAGLIEQILGGAGWEKVYNDILKGGSKSLKELQKQFNKTKDGIDEVTQAQKDAYDAAVEAGKAAYEARKALEDEASAWKTLTNAVDEFKSSVSNIAVSSILPTDAKEFGQFESAVVDGLAQIKDSLKSAFDNGYIYEQAYRDLQAYAEKEFALLQANARQRDALAAKYSFVKNLLADYRSAFTSALNLTSLVQSLDKKTKEITVTEVTAGINSVSESLNNFRTTVTRSWTETVNETANTASGLVDKFRAVADKTRVFADNLKKLKELGLDPQLFNQLVQAGVEAGGETAQALIDGGAATIQELNGIFKDIADAGVKAGELVATDLYNTGSDFASSLLDGIKSQQTAFEKAAETLAGAFKDQFNLDVGTATDAVLSDLQSSLDSLNAEKKRIEGRLQEENLILTGGKAGPGARAAAQTKITSYTAQLQAVVDQIANLQAQISSAKIPALASGGIALDSALAMVGEAGPEAIIPLSKLGAVTGGGTTNITINVTADTRAGGIAAGEAIIGALKTYAQAGGPVSNLLGAAQVTL